VTECPICGSTDLQRIKCKVSCLNCKTILQTCADSCAHNLTVAELVRETERLGLHCLTRYR